MLRFEVAAAHALDNQYQTLLNQAVAQHTADVDGWWSQIATQVALLSRTWTQSSTSLLERPHGVSMSLAHGHFDDYMLRIVGQQESVLLPLLQMDERIYDILRRELMQRSQRRQLTYVAPQTAHHDVRTARMRKPPSRFADDWRMPRG
jgi:hypothetical protein